MEPSTRTRRPTSAEIHAARFLGQPDPEAIEVDLTPSAALHAARMVAPRKSAKPAGMQTAEWYARRASAVDGEDPDEVEETEEEPAAGRGGSWGAGTRSVRTEGGTIV
ncbi:MULTISPECIES: hypothetical protein [Streptomyces]|uniref:FXSXX-COOH protein n=2 Tax=Streptomyces TaxID=1883 RepID=A0ABV9IQC4_9ACTN